MTMLNVVLQSGSEADKVRAAKIAPLRATGNRLLCVLLITNTAVNAGLAITMAGITSGFTGSNLDRTTRILGRRTAPFPPFLIPKQCPAWTLPKILVLCSSGFLLSTLLIMIFGEITPQARPVLASWAVLKGSPELQRDILRAKPPARAHTGAPHCGSHCHQLGVCLTLQFLRRRPSAHAMA